MDMHGGEGDQGLARPAFRDQGRSTGLLPASGYTHSCHSLGGVRLS